MSDFKPLLPINGRTALETAIRLFRNAGIDTIYVVLGHRAADLQPLVESTGARPVLNPQFQQGMFTSVRAGTSALPTFTRACFVLPVDIPLVREQTVRQMAAVFDSRRYRILYPVYAGRRGHPPLIASDLLQQSSASPGPLSALLATHEKQAAELAVPDEAIHLDMDTAEDYARLRALASTRDVPSVGECEAILASFSVPQPRLEHSRLVAITALRLAGALREHGFPLNLPLVNAGALLHDLAKGAPHHAQAGAASLQSLGFPEVAAIVAAHMDLDFSGQQLDEAAIVFLADKLTRGTHSVSLEQRFQPAIERFRDDPDALASAHRRRTTAEAVAAAVEAKLGRPLKTVLGDFCH